MPEASEGPSGYAFHWMSARTRLASWPSEGPVTGSLHDTEQAIVEHVVGALITESDASGRDLRDAQRMRQ